MIDTISIQLIGAPTCRRYQKMRTIVQDEAAPLGLVLALEEINDTARLAQINPLSLPQLHIGGKLVAQGNPPKPVLVRQILRRLAAPLPNAPTNP